jgi:hypothetical protein
VGNERLAAQVSTRKHCHTRRTSYFAVTSDVTNNPAKLYNRTNIDRVEVVVVEIECCYRSRTAVDDRPRKELGKRMSLKNLKNARLRVGVFWICAAI